jgi:hypothetical protein
VNENITRQVVLLDSGELCGEFVVNALYVCPATTAAAVGRCFYRVRLVRRGAGLYECGLQHTLALHQHLHRVCVLTIDWRSPHRLYM